MGFQYYVIVGFMRGGRLNEMCIDVGSKEMDMNF